MNAKAPSGAAPKTRNAATAALIAQQRAEALALRLPPLLLAAERVAATVAQGVHGRRRVGQGEAFWQFRRYQPGDSASAIDWRQSAKSQHIFIRETEWEAAQSAWLWRDTSGSMDWRSDGALPTKRARADLLLLALAVLLVRGGERVALLNSGSPPSSARSSLPSLALRLVSPATPENGAKVPQAALLKAALPQIEPLPRHAQLVIIGDLLSPLEEIQARMAGFSGRGLRGHLLQVLDPAEETLPYDGRVQFQGMEGETALLIPRVQSIRDQYHQRLNAQKQGLAALARTAGWSYTLHRTDRPPQTALLSLWSALTQEIGL